VAPYQTFPEVADFLAELPREEIAREIALGSGVRLAEAQRRLDNYLNEVNVGFAVVRPLLAKEHRLIEVGSGLGALSALLARLGFRIARLDPVGQGFDFCGVARQVIEKFVPAPIDASYDCRAEELSPSRHGMFDLIFSLNVLEHVGDIDAAIGGMKSVLNLSGVMVHLCPNYALPYEPHTGLPLLPFFPRSTRFFMPKRITGTALWQSLNFVTARDIDRAASRHGLVARFQPGLLADMLDRMQHDSMFAARHSSRMARMAQNAAFRSLLRRMPARFASPMLIELRHAHASRDQRR
jgi:2-polyprenyl-3-methyl-5-hydroxy-6-metoxy-1,4-benzoquinol methylase